MNCRNVLRELSNYIDGDLDAAVKQEIETHLNLCGDCKIVVNTTKVVVDIYCDEQPIDLPSEVRARLHTALRKKLSSPGA